MILHLLQDSVFLGHGHSFGVLGISNGYCARTLQHVVEQKRMVDGLPVVVLSQTGFTIRLSANTLLYNCPCDPGVRDCMCFAVAYRFRAFSCSEELWHSVIVRGQNRLSAERAEVERLRIGDLRVTEGARHDSSEHPVGFKGFRLT